MDMFSRDATTTLREQRKAKGHNQVARLKALLLNHEWERAMAQPPSSADLIMQVIQDMWFNLGQTIQ